MKHIRVLSITCTLVRIWSNYTSFERDRQGLSSDVWYDHIQTTIHIHEASEKYTKHKQKINECAF
jgi:hypothetical protein